MDKNNYKTVKNSGYAEFIEKRSRFIANVKPVVCEEEALEFLNELKQKHWDAKHNVYAYIIRENNIMRYSDDGEPGGTAGVPVLDMLKKEGLTDVAVVVTRYFGGILLGTGGLVHAYSKSAKLGIEAAGICEMTLCRNLKLKYNYDMIGKIQYEIAQFKSAFCGDTDYLESVETNLFVPVDKTDSFIAYITDKTNGNILIEQNDVEYFNCT